MTKVSQSNRWASLNTTTKSSRLWASSQSDQPVKPSKYTWSILVQFLVLPFQLIFYPRQRTSDQNWVYQMPCRLFVSQFLLAVFHIWQSIVIPVNLSLSESAQTFLKFICCEFCFLPTVFVANLAKLFHDHAFCTIENISYWCITLSKVSFLLR